MRSSQTLLAVTFIFARRKTKARAREMVEVVMSDAELLTDSERTAKFIQLLPPLSIGLPDPCEAELGN